MSHEIGDVYVQAVEEFSPDMESRSQSIYKGMFRRPTVRGGSKTAESFDLVGHTWAEGVKNEDDFIEDIRALTREAAYNRINLGNRVGFLNVKDIKSKKTADMANMREYAMSGYFSPVAQYEASVQLDTVAFTDEWNKGIVPFVPLPVGATNVRVKSPWQSITLLNPAGTITGADGAVPVYQPFPVFDWRTYGCALAGATPAVATFDAAVYSGKKISLTHFADETIIWTFVAGKDAPLCKYKLGFRVEDGAAAGAFTVTVAGSVSGTILSAESHATAASAGAWEHIETAEISLLTSETITVTVTKATNDNVFSINYGYLIPQNTCRITFDAADEYETGECRVYDTVTTGNTVVATWKRVYNDEHIFSGDMVFQNSFLRWTIKQATAWSTATTLTELISNNTGTLYPVAFAADLTDVLIDEILPNQIRLKVRMDVGAATTYDSLNDIETAEITITPTAFYFDLSRIGQFRYDWGLYMAGANYLLGSGLIDKSGSSANQSSPFFMIGLSGAAIGMQKTVTGDSRLVPGTAGSVLYTASSTTSYPAAGNKDYTFSLFMIPVTLNYSGSQYTISQDNSGAERKFFKDDFSNNTIANYTTSGTPAIASGVCVFNTAGDKIVKTLDAGATTGKWEVVWKQGAGTYGRWYMYLGGTTTYLDVLRADSNVITMGLKINGTWLIAQDALAGSDVAIDTYCRFSVTYDGVNYKIYQNETLKSTTASTTAPSTPSIGFVSEQSGKTQTINEFTYTPSVAFTDLFAADDESRYMQLVTTDITLPHTTGTWATAAAGDVAVAGGVMTVTSADDEAICAVLRSYNFGSGEYEFAFDCNNDGGGGLDCTGAVFCYQDILNHYKVVLEDSDGAGTAENLKIYKVVAGTATLLGTAKDVTARYAKGTKCYVKVQYSRATGQMWAYLKDNTGASSGLYPTTPDISDAFSSQFAYGKVGLWAAVTTAGAGNLNVDFDDVTIRASLLIGETNVPATETGFYFRDEGAVDSIGRYTTTGTWTVSGGLINCTVAGNLTMPFQTTIGVHSFIPTLANGTDYYYFGGYRIKFVASGGNACTVTLETTAGVAQGTGSLTVTTVAGLFANPIIITETATAITVTVAGSTGTIVSGTTTSTNAYPKFTVGTATCSFDNYSFLGTRYYNKPMLRGAQIGEYWNGTASVPCTRFTDDCGWNTTTEYPSLANVSYNTARGFVSANSGIFCVPFSATAGTIRFKYRFTFGNVTDGSNKQGFGFGLSSSETVTSITDASTTNSLNLSFRILSGAIQPTWRQNGVTSYLANIDAAPSTSKFYDVEIIISGTSLTINYTGSINLTQTATIVAIPTGYIWWADYNMGVTNSMGITNISVDALESTSTNGVAVTLGGVAHGARYDITEYAKKALVAGTGIMPGIYRMVTRKISTVASASNDYETDNLFQNATDAATASIEVATTTEKSTNTTAWTEEREFVRVAAADAADSMEFGLQRRQATSLSSDSAPATFLDFMQLIPAFNSGGAGEQFGIGDLAFMTTQNPSYVRRVEQKSIV